MIDVVQLSKMVLARLSAMDYELKGGGSNEQLIFPKKIQGKGSKHINRISEQELRLLFIEEFKIAYPELFYSIETPTINKYYFGDAYESINSKEDGQSASLDMCIFERISGNYNRILNIEFKHKNSGIKNIGKDVIKLMQEEQDGAFIHLLKNTDGGTLCNRKKTGTFGMLFKSFSDFHANWNGVNKSIQLVIISLDQNTLIHRGISKSDLDNLDNIFFVNIACGNIKSINNNGWNCVTI